MADFVFNRAKGRIVEFAERVNANDPTNSAFVLLVINTSTADSVLRDLDTVAQIEADGGTAEVTNSGYARKTLANGDLTITYDDTNDRVDVSCASQTFNSVAAGTAWTDLVIAYDPDTTAGTDTTLVPLVQLDCPVTPDGSNITINFNAAGFFRAS